MILKLDLIQSLIYSEWKISGQNMSAKNVRKNCILKAVVDNEKVLSLGQNLNSIDYKEK